MQYMYCRLSSYIPLQAAHFPLHFTPLEQRLWGISGFTCSNSYIYEYQRVIGIHQYQYCHNQLYTTIHNNYLRQRILTFLMPQAKLDKLPQLSEFATQRFCSIMTVAHSHGAIIVRQAMRMQGQMQSVIQCFDIVAGSRSHIHPLVKTFAIPLNDKILHFRIKS